MNTVVNRYPAYVPPQRPEVLLTQADVEKWRGFYQRTLKILIDAGARDTKKIEDCEQHLALLGLAEKQLARKAR